MFKIRHDNFHHKRNLDVDIYVRLRRVLIARHNKVRVALRWRNCCQCEQKRLRGNTGLHHRSAALKAPAGSRVESDVVDVEFDAKNTSWSKLASFLRLKSRHRVIRSPLSRPGAVAARLARQCKPTTYLEEALASTQVLHRPSLAERAAIGSGREVVGLAQNLQDVSFRVKSTSKASVGQLDFQPALSKPQNGAVPRSSLHLATGGSCSTAGQLGPVVASCPRHQNTPHHVNTGYTQH